MGGECVLDEVDVRVLTRALYQQLLGTGTDRGHGTKNGKSREQRGYPRAVTGKHIIVSMGAKGLIWCGPRHIIAGEDEDGGSNRGGGGGGGGGGSAVESMLQNIVVDEESQSATCWVPVSPIDASLIRHTNGARDAMVAGLVAEIMALRQASKGAEAGGEMTSWPNEQCIRAGLMAAHHRLISN